MTGTARHHQHPNRRAHHSSHHSAHDLDSNRHAASINPRRGDEPISGYKNRVITRTYDHLSEDGDRVFVVIRNPKLVPPADLQPRDIPLNPDGTPADPAQAMQASFEVLARLVVAWRVYDASYYNVDDPDADQPLLGMPATPDLVAKLPLDIIQDLSETLNGEAGPPSVPQEALTSTT